MVSNNDQSVFELRGKQVFVAGHRGMVGSALVRRLRREGCEIIVAERASVDLKRQSEVECFITSARPDCIVICAAVVGGIHANNTRPADFLYDNLIIQANIIEAAHQAGVDRLLVLGSTCIYPRLAPQPMAEESLLTGPLEPTNQWYAIAKIAGVKMCDAYRQQFGRHYISAMPTNLYGPNDNFDLQSSHVLPALIRKIHEAKFSQSPDVVIWGDGKAMRDFLYVDDLADALVFLLRRYDEAGPINIGTGEEISIYNLARLIARVIGYDAEFKFDATKPNGAPRKVTDISKLASLGWRASTSLEDGVRGSYDWFVSNISASAEAANV